MEIFVAADIFRSPNRTLFQDLERVVVYIDDIMIINSSTIEDQLQATGEKYLAAKYFFPYFKLRKNVRHK